MARSAQRARPRNDLVKGAIVDPFRRHLPVNDWLQMNNWQVAEEFFRLLSRDYMPFRVPARPFKEDPINVAPFLRSFLNLVQRELILDLKLKR